MFQDAIGQDRQWTAFGSWDRNIRSDSTEPEVRTAVVRLKAAVLLVSDGRAGRNLANLPDIVGRVRQTPIPAQQLSQRAGTKPPTLHNQQISTQ